MHKMTGFTGTSLCINHHCHANHRGNMSSPLPSSCPPSSSVILRQVLLNGQNESIERKLESFKLQMSSIAEDDTVSPPHLHKHRRNETHSYFLSIYPISTSVDKTRTNSHKYGEVTAPHAMPYTLANRKSQNTQI